MWDTRSNNLWVVGVEEAASNGFQTRAKAFKVSSHITMSELMIIFFRFQHTSGILELYNGICETLFATL